MKTSTKETLFKIVAAILCATAAVFALVVDNDAQLPLYMAAGVIASLACFDAALDRANRSFWPWFLISMSILLKAAPRVLFDLADEGSASLDRHDDLGAILAGASVALALVLLALPSKQERATFRSSTKFSLLVIVLSGVVCAFAGATVAHVADPGFSSAGEARLAETVGWGLVGVIIAASFVSVFIAERTTRSFSIFILGAGAVAVLLAMTSAGVDLDIGWWALGWAVFAISALIPGRALLGERYARTRASLVHTLVALGAMLMAGAVVIWSIVGDINADVWDTGKIGLIASSFALALIALIAHGRTGEEVIVAPTGAALAGSSAAGSLSTTTAKGAFDTPWTGTSSGPVADTSSAPASAQAGGASVFARETAPVPTQPASGHDVAAIEAAFSAEPSNASASAADVPYSEPSPTTSMSSTVTPGWASNRRPAPLVAVPARLVTGLSSRHIDPSTQLLSAAGLQQVMANTFADGAPEAGQVALLLIAVRNAETLESTHGRLAIESIYKQLAERLDAALPDAACARYARSGFGAMFYASDGPVVDVVERSTQALLSALEGFEVRGELIEVDVAGGLAQCYNDEQPANLALRASEGLEEAADIDDSTLVAMQ